MFDFERLEVYQKAKEFHRSTILWISGHPKISKSIQGQLERASLSIPLNIAEGNARFSKADRRNFLVIARGSVYECVAIFDVLSTLEFVSIEELTEFRERLEELSKLLFAMIRNLQ